LTGEFSGEFTLVKDDITLERLPDIELDRLDSA
jgi:hypothetical protein